MDRTGQIFEGRYRLQRTLGSGGMATVYAARDEKLDKAVAVKVLDSELAAHAKAARRFVQEARAAARVRHPNVIDVTDHGVSADGAAYLVMELLRGEDLAATLAREGPLPWARVGPIALQVCAALAAAHRVGVIHRDIKPSNLVRVHTAGNPDFIKVLDFGIARVTGEARGLVEPTTAGLILGTPEYIAPELATGAAADPRSDLYALGAVLYKLLTGEPLFEADNPSALLYKQIFDPPVPPRRRAPGRAIPEAAERVVLAALAKDPGARPVDMIAFARAIAGALPGRPPVERWLDPAPLDATLSLPAMSRPALPEPAARAAARAPGRRLAGALAGGALVVAGALALRGAWAEGPATVAEDMSGATAPPRQVETRMSPGTDGPAGPRAAGPLAAGAEVQGSARGADAPAAHDAPAGAPAEVGPRVDPASDAPAASARAPASPPRSAARRERFDGAGLRRALVDAEAAVRACALASNMFRGELALVVGVDGAGQVSRVGPTPGGRAIEPGALACIRRELADVRLAGGAGELVHVFPI